jgi:hypothetical protein
LSNVNAREFIDRLYFHDHLILDDQIESVSRCERLALVLQRNDELTRYRQASFAKFAV